MLSGEVCVYVSPRARVCVCVREREHAHGVVAWRGSRGTQWKPSAVVWVRDCYQLRGPDGELARSVRKETLC